MPVKVKRNKNNRLKLWRKVKITEQKQQMPRMGKTEEDWNGLELGFFKTVQPNSFSKLIPTACNFKNNARETYLFASNLWFVIYMQFLCLL